MDNEKKSVVPSIFLVSIGVTKNFKASFFIWVIPCSLGSLKNLTDFQSRQLITAHRHDSVLEVRHGADFKYVSQDFNTVML